MYINPDDNSSQCLLKENLKGLNPRNTLDLALVIQILDYEVYFLKY